jgi:2-keto-4-pentenoate hydratase/2-oxohepta-3-ene-1,7-dioic acid hydratase in catechol pathway
VKIVSYRVDGKPHFGLLRDDKVIDLSRRLSRYTDIVDFMAKGSLDEARALADAAPDCALRDLTLLPVVPNPGKIICVGLNYAEHAKEGIRDPNDKPMLFARWPETLTAHGDPLVIPRVSDKLDFEAELLAVIGKPTGRYLPAEKALDKVFGYACMNEGSVRDWQRHSSQVTAGKNFVGTGPTGPWIVTADELGDPQTLDLTLRVNGAVMQHANTKDMIWPVADTIAYISNWIPLNPGDLIATGTPAGVGSRRTPPVFLKPGDVVEVDISRVGVLRNEVVREA